MLLFQYRSSHKSEWYDDTVTVSSSLHICRISRTSCARRVVPLRWRDEANIINMITHPSDWGFKNGLKLLTIQIVWQETVATHSSSTSFSNRCISGSHRLHLKTQKPSLVPGLSVLCYCRKMAVQHSDLHGGGPAPYVDIKSSFEGNENTLTLILRGLYTN